jgi:small subunit ribosomal protein S7
MELKNQINNKISYLDSSLINKLINQILKKGNKYKSFLIMNKVFKYIKKESGLNINPILLITIALNNVKPFIEVKSYKKRNVSLRVPSVISNDRQIALAIKWVIQGAKSRKNKEFAKNLADELIDAYSYKGNAIKSKLEMHKLAILHKRFIFSKK